MSRSCLNVFMAVKYMEIGLSSRVANGVGSNTLALLTEPLCLYTPWGGGGMGVGTLHPRIAYSMAVVDTCNQ